MERPMTPTSRRSVLAAFSALGAAAVLPRAALARVPVSAADALWRGLALEDAAGRTFQLGQGPAPVSLVALWAHWCQPCVSELPGLVALQAALGNRAEIVLLSHPEYWQQDQALVRRMRLPLRFATPAAANGPAAIRTALLNAGGGYEVPRSLVFRANEGTVTWHNRGWSDWAAADGPARVRALIG